MCSIAWVNIYFLIPTSIWGYTAELCWKFVFNYLINNVAATFYILTNTTQGFHVPYIHDNTY